MGALLFDANELGKRGEGIDLYQLLGLNPRATQRDIRSAYYIFAKANHPDRAGGAARSESAFKTTALAFAILRDPATRKLYDRGDIDARGAITIRGRRHLAQRRILRAFAFSFSFGAVAAALVAVLLCATGVISPPYSGGEPPGFEVATATGRAHGQPDETQSLVEGGAPITWSASEEAKALPETKKGTKTAAAAGRRRDASGHRQRLSQ
jgi:curved DNA-binding protein CbpA